MLLGRFRLANLDAKPFVPGKSKAVPVVAPESLPRPSPDDARLQVLGHALLDELPEWALGGPGQRRPSQADHRFLVVATSLPFQRLKLSAADYKEMLARKQKDPDETEPLRFSSMLLYPRCFELVDQAGQARPAQQVGRLSGKEELGIEFMKPRVSMLENQTTTPRSEERQHVFLTWEVPKDFAAKNLRVRFENDDPVGVPVLVLETFRPGKPYHPSSRTFSPGEGGIRLRNNLVRGPGL